MFIIDNDTSTGLRVERVRVSSNGNIVRVDNPLAGRVPPDTTIYSTLEEAEAEIERRINNCHHSWVMHSHDEKRCLKCGALVCVPDV